MTCYPRQILRQTKDFTILSTEPVRCFSCGTRIPRVHQRRHALCKHCACRETAAWWTTIQRTLRVSTYYEEERDG